MPAHRKPTPEMYCESCGKRLERKRLPNGDLEYLIHFTRRKFCDLACFARSRTGLFQNGVLPAEGRYRARTLTEKRSCEQCGSTGNLDVHHRDQDPLNNSAENRQVLCRSCHLKTHNPRGSCSVCGKPQKGLGYCDKHYQRFKKYGDPLMVKRNQHTPLVKSAD